MREEVLCLPSSRFVQPFFPSHFILCSIFIPCSTFISILSLLLFFWKGETFSTFPNMWIKTAAQRALTLSSSHFLSSSLVSESEAYILVYLLHLSSSLFLSFFFLLLSPFSTKLNLWRSQKEAKD